MQIVATIETMSNIFNISNFFNYISLFRRTSDSYWLERRCLMDKNIDFIKCRYIVNWLGQMSDIQQTLTRSTIKYSTIVSFVRYSTNVGTILKKNTQNPSKIWQYDRFYWYCWSTTLIFLPICSSVPSS